MFAVRLICCGRDDGYQICRTADEAHSFRDQYVESGDLDRVSGWHHERIGIVMACVDQDIGWAASLQEQEET